MFNTISKKLGSAIKKLSSSKSFSEKDITSALDEIRILLLESDVPIEVADELVLDAKSNLLESKNCNGIPKDILLKAIYDSILKLLGDQEIEPNIKGNPAIFMMVGLQGSGKTTTCAKLATYLKSKYKLKPLVLSVDNVRPAAIHQLQTLSKRAEIDYIDPTDIHNPTVSIDAAIKHAKFNGNDLLIIDTAGRLHIDLTSMEQLKNLQNKFNPQELLLVVDSMMGQDSLRVAREFSTVLKLSGVIMTRVDGDGGGGAAIAMRKITGSQIRYLGTGENIVDLETFYPKRVLSRFIDLGDIETLMEKVKINIDDNEVEKIVDKAKSGTINMNDMLKQFKNLKKMGGIMSVMKFLPGMGQLGNTLANKDIDGSIGKMEAIIQSMTASERGNPNILNSSRKFRICRGSGSTIQDLNSLLKKMKDMNRMVQKFGNMDPSQLSSMIGGMPTGFGKN